MKAITRRKAIALSMIPAVGGGLLSSRAAQAQPGYPSRPIKLVLGFTPGGAPDIATRRIADALSRRLGQPVIVENRPGASANIAATFVAKSPPDGYTILYSTNTTHAMNVHLYSNLGFDPVKDFSPIILQGQVSNVLSVHPSFEAQNLHDFMELCKSRPGRVNVASNGNSTSTHLGLELLKISTGIEFAHIPFKGSAAAITSVIGGQVPALMDNLPPSLPYIRSKRLNALAVSSRTRLPHLPDVPTFDEAGVKGYEVVGWGGFWAPAGTPASIVEKLNFEFNQIFKDPEFIKFILEIGSIPLGGTPQQLADFSRAETEKWGKVIRSANVKLD